MLRLILVLVFLTPTVVAAQDRRSSHCIAVAEAIPGATLWRAGWREPVERNTVRISYIDHAMFLIQAEDGISAATDYTGFLGLVDFAPDAVTMNNGHETHWTSLPDPEIPHALRGWPEGGTPADHHLDLGSMLIRNVPTDRRSPFGDDQPLEGGNSIFVFEVAGLCIGHLGHLHHALTDQHYAALGRLDVVMAPVDGGFTLSRDELKETLSRLRSSIVIPMHWFSPFNLERFLDEMSETYAIQRLGQSAIDLSLFDLPDRPTIMVLKPNFLRKD
ncbi:MAG: MBL fold metallo-hydrolase [Pseudomonadota bacterium]